MEKSRIYAAICVAVGMAVAGYAIKGGMDNFTNRNRMVTVKGLAEKEVKADKVTWMIYVKGEGSTPKDASDAAGVSGEKLVGFLKTCGIQENEITESATSINPEQWWDDKARVSRIVGYNATKNVNVSSKNVEVVRKALARQDELIDMGVMANSNQYGNSTDDNVIYEIENFQSMKLDLMDEAIVNAEAAAKRFAENSKSKVGRIITANQGEININDKDRLTPHIKKVRLVSTITYALED
ncbi:MAG: SIMPL domain-containing protein [Bacteroidaceae bacterium]|nr:SIMPL domain-containing protein [Bacteroidaceae bacterium]